MDEFTHDKRAYFNRRLGELKAEYEPHRAKHKLIKEYIVPETGRFDDERGILQSRDPDYDSILNGYASQASSDFVAFLMAGMSSPARPWFKLVHEDESRELNADEQSWLDYYRDLMLEVFARSNFYQTLPRVYEEGGNYGNGCMYIAEDFEKVVHFHHYTIGEYYFGLNDKGEVDTVYRPFQMKVKQLVNKFGLESCSQKVQRLWKEKQYGVYVDICHVIEPNTKDLPEPLRHKNPGFKYISVYFETSKNDEVGKQLLRHSGYRTFPAMPFRMYVRTNDPWATGIGHEALPDVKGLQAYELALATGVDYMVEPELQTYSNNIDPVRHPGKTHQLNPTGDNKGMWPTHQVNIPVQYLEQRIERIEQRIGRWYHNDLARFILNDGRSNTTAREIEAIESEKLLLAGPKIESVQNFLSPAIERTFEIMITNGVGAPPPETLRGANLGVEYIGILTQAQKAVGTRAIERTWQFAASIAEVQANFAGVDSVIDKLNAEESLSDYARMVGSPVDQMRSDEDVAEIREGRRQQQEHAMAMQRAEQLAGTAKTLSDTDLNEGNALSEALNTVGAGL